MSHNWIVISFLLAAIACAVYNYTDLLTYSSDEEAIKLHQSHQSQSTKKQQNQQNIDDSNDEYPGDYDSMYDAEFESFSNGEDWATWNDDGFTEDLRV